MKTKVAYKCTVYDSNDDELFHVTGDDQGVVADIAANRAREKYPLQSVSWQFEKIYPVPEPFQPPNMDDRLEKFVNGVTAIANG